MRFRDMFKQLDPKLIKIEAGFNVRDYSLEENKQHLQNLKASIKDCGVQQNLWVRLDAADNSYYLIDGECRLRAVLELIAEGFPIVEVPTKIVEAGNEIERKLLSLTANSGKPLNKWEAGNGYKQLKGWGWTDATISARVGVTERYVREAIELSSAPQQVKELLSTGQVTPRLALNTTRQHGSNAGTILLEKVADAQSQGQTTAKAERKTTEQDFEKITRAIYNDCSGEYEENEMNYDTEAYYMNVAVNAELLRRLFKLVEIEAPRPEKQNVKKA
jgi:ParB-like chromosome segregation protein Spo0J